MRRFDTFGEYMFDLLFAPLKKAKRSVNQLRIFFRVVGREFDDVKAAIFRVRDEANVATASPAMLPVHGQDRDMPRLEGESVEAYRARLCMKGLVAEWGGTKQGVLYALAALGYEQSHIEPFSLQDPERWAEFIIFLKGSARSGVNNLAVIDAEVRKVKEGSSKPAYGTEAGGIIIIRSQTKSGVSAYPRCGEIACGVFPHRVNIGHLVACEVSITGGATSGEVEFPKVGTIAASEKFFQKCGFVLYEGFSSDIVAGPEHGDGLKQYPRCSPSTRCSGTTYRKGGELNA